MSYLLPASEGGSMNGGKTYDWFVNALNSIDQEHRPAKSPSSANVFKDKYGYPVVWRSSPDGEYARLFVNFPNEGEATMFLLRWS